MPPPMTTPRSCRAAATARICMPEEGGVSTRVTGRSCQHDSLTCLSLHRVPLETKHACACSMKLACSMYVLPSRGAPSPVVLLPLACAESAPPPPATPAVSSSDVWHTRRAMAAYATGRSSPHACSSSMHTRTKHARTAPRAALSRLMTGRPRDMRGRAATPPRMRVTGGCHTMASPVSALAARRWTFGRSSACLRTERYCCHKSAGSCWRCNGGLGE